MSFIPSDWTGFLWGVLVGGVVAFGTGFLKKAGEHVFSWLAAKVNPGPPEPVQVDGKFVPTRFAPALCAWVSEVKLYEHEEMGFFYYPHPKNNAKCFRITSDGKNPIKEFLLVKPEAQDVA